MADDFIFTSNIDEFSKAMKATSNKIKRVGVNVSNTIAFQGRRNVLKELDKTMTIRDKRFIERHVIVKKASFNKPVASVGSIKRERFTGWEEQETGKKDTRKKVQTVAARRGKFSNRVTPRFRLKRGSKKAARPSDFGLSNSGRGVVAFLEILSRKDFREWFYIPFKFKKLDRGLYIFRGRKRTINIVRNNKSRKVVRKKIAKIQNLNPKNTQPKRNRWMTNSLRQITNAFVQSEFIKESKKIIKY